MSKKDKTSAGEIITYIVVLLIVFMAAQHLNVVVSGSMEPVFARGDIVAVEKTNFFGIHEFNANDVKVGNIVVYDAKWHSKPVIHKVIDMKEVNGSTFYQIKGDNNKVADPYWVSPNQIKEKVITINDQPVVIPYIGYVNIWFRGL